MLRGEIRGQKAVEVVGRHLDLRRVAHGDFRWKRTMVQWLTSGLSIGSCQ